MRHYLFIAMKSDIMVLFLFMSVWRARGGNRNYLVFQSADLLWEKVHILDKRILFAVLQSPNSSETCSKPDHFWRWFMPQSRSPSWFRVGEHWLYGAHSVCQRGLCWWRMGGRKSWPKEEWTLMRSWGRNAFQSRGGSLDRLPGVWSGKHSSGTQKQESCTSEIFGGINKMLLSFTLLQAQGSGRKQTNKQTKNNGLFSCPG